MVIVIFAGAAFDVGDDMVVKIVLVMVVMMIFVVMAVK